MGLPINHEALKRGALASLSGISFCSIHVLKTSPEWHFHFHSQIEKNRKIIQCIRDINNHSFGCLWKVGQKRKQVLAMLSLLM